MRITFYLFACCFALVPGTAQEPLQSAAFQESSPTKEQLKAEKKALAEQKKIAKEFEKRLVMGQSVEGGPDLANVVPADMEFEEWFERLTTKMMKPPKDKSAKRVQEKLLPTALKSMPRQPTPVNSQDEQRPFVFHAGNLPVEIPTWFKQLDGDEDAQIGLYEWRQSGWTVEEFRFLDRNDDGFLTAAELLFAMAQLNDHPESNAWMTTASERGKKNNALLVAKKKLPKKPKRRV